MKIDIEEICKASGNKLADKGLAKLLADGDLAQVAAKWLEEDLGLSSPVANLFIRALAQLATHVAKNGGAAAGSKIAGAVGAVIGKWIVKIPSYSRLNDAVDALSARLSNKAAAQREFSDILSGKRLARDAAFGKYLASDLCAHLTSLRSLEELHLKLDDVFAALRPQPVLNLRTLPDDGSGLRRFFFGTQKIPFIGRNKELSELEDFLSMDGYFSWWLWHGQGGQGKSRLALELCLRHAYDWRVGFLSFGQEDDFDFSRWEPDQPTLIVCDYVEMHAKKVGEVALRLYERGQQLAVPVRLLLLARDDEKRWFNEFWPPRGDGLAIGAAQFAPPRYLDEMDDDEIWAIFEFFIDREKLPNRRATLAAFRRIDPKKRPLFAALMADSLASGRDPRKWGPYELLRFILSREKDVIWRAGQVTDEDQYMLCVSTLCGGVSVEVAKNDQFAKSFITRGISDRYRVMCGRSVGDEGIFNPLEPDIIGELYCLDLLYELDRDFHGEVVDGLVQTAWRLSDGGFAGTLIRMLDDFRHHPQIPRILAIQPDERERLVKQAVVAGIAAATYISDDDEQHAVGLSLLDKLREIANGDGHELQLPLATSLCLSAIKLIEDGKIDDAWNIYESFSGLVHAHPDNDKIREYFCFVSVNISIALADALDIGRIMEVYNGIECMHEAFPDAPGVAEALIRVASPLLCLLEVQGEHELFLSIYEKIRLVVMKNLLHDEVVQRFVNTNFKLISRYEKKGEAEKAMQYYGEMIRLWDLSPFDAEMAIDIYLSAYFVVNLLVSSGRIDMACQTLGTLPEIVPGQAEGATLRSFKSKSIATVVYKYCDLGLEVSASEYLKKIAIMADENSGEPELKRVHKAVLKTVRKTFHQPKGR
ncbi:MAG: hypothetical protein H7841_15580 [Magnetospirillum sp. WYHS-4]